MVLRTPHFNHPIHDDYTNSLCPSHSFFRLIDWLIWTKIEEDLRNSDQVVSKRAVCLLTDSMGGRF